MSDALNQVLKTVNFMHEWWTIQSHISAMVWEQIQLQSTLAPV